MFDISIQKKIKLGVYVVVFFLIGTVAHTSFAQKQVLETDKSVAVNSQNADGSSVVKDKAVKKLAKLSDRPTFPVGRMQSLFFTFWQHQAILDAKKIRGKGGVVRAPSDSELDGVIPENAPRIRDLTLSGIVYRKKDDWVIWLNGKRVTPNAVPKEVLDLKVFNDYIEVKWLDEFSNNVFPIRLRAHQRFNLDARIYLPG